MPRMIRKQVYIYPAQEELLKRTARELGVTESELIRRGIEQAVPTGADRARGVLMRAGTERYWSPDLRAWEEALSFMKQRGEMEVPQTGRTWTRDELYEDD